PCEPCARASSGRDARPGRARESFFPVVAARRSGRTRMDSSPRRSAVLDARASEPVVEGPSLAPEGQERSGERREREHARERPRGGGPEPGARAVRAGDAEAEEPLPGRGAGRGDEGGVGEQESGERDESAPRGEAEGGEEGEIDEERRGAHEDAGAERATARPARRERLTALEPFEVGEGRAGAPVAARAARPRA